MAKRRRQSPLAALIDEPGPTPETRAKLRGDPILDLYERGIIDFRQRVAAEEIRTIYEAVVARLFASPGLEFGVDGGRRARRHPLDGIEPELRRAYLAKYVPWSHRVKRVLKDVIDAIVDGHMPDEGGRLPHPRDDLRRALDWWPRD